MKRTGNFRWVIASILAGPAWGFYQFFLPDFLKKNFQLDLTAMAWWTSAFYIIAAIGGVAGGWLAGWLLVNQLLIPKIGKA